MKVNKEVLAGLQTDTGDSDKVLNSSNSLTWLTAVATTCSRLLWLKHELYRMACSSQKRRTLRLL